MIRVTLVNSASLNLDHPHLGFFFWLSYCTVMVRTPPRVDLFFFKFIIVCPTFVVGLTGRLSLWNRAPSSHPENMVDLPVVHDSPHSR